jgi:hypothetical protein
VAGGSDFRSSDAELSVRSGSLCASLVEREIATVTIDNITSVDELLNLVGKERMKKRSKDKGIKKKETVKRSRRGEAIDKAAPSSNSPAWAFLS